MSLLPTAHAGQSFGSRRIDFFTVSGEISGSDAGTGRVTDGDGVVHDVRLIERSSAFAKGDSATVLRVQSGPNRRSRPAAIINHSRGLWMRAAPEATTILARSGVTRTLNWWLSLLALVLVAIAAAWPSLHTFLTELNGAMMAGIPAVDIYAELGAPLPGLTSWRLETALSPGLFDGIAALGFVPMERLTEWGLATAVAALSLVAFFARSWRLVYVPALAVLCVFSGAILGSPVVSLAMIGTAALLFILGGFVNRVRDGGRFNARVERLAEYVLRHPPEEGVRTSEPTRVEAPAPLAAAAAATAIAAASAVAEGDERDETAVSPVAESGAPDETEAVTATEDLEEDDTPGSDEAAPAAPAESGTNGEIAAETAAGGESADDEAARAGEQNVNADADDDLPSLEAVAAAAALSDVERAAPLEASTAAGPVALDDERTMAVAAPPPMPAPPADAADAEESVEDPAATGSRAEPLAAEPMAEEPVATDANETETEEEAALADEPGASTPAIDDPMIDDDGDPMVERASGDFAPGAPDVELDRDLDREPGN